MPGIPRQIRACDGARPWNECSQSCQPAVRCQPKTHHSPPATRNRSRRNIHPFGRTAFEKLHSLRKCHGGRKRNQYVDVVIGAADRESLETIFLRALPPRYAQRSACFTVGMMPRRPLVEKTQWKRAEM